MLSGCYVKPVAGGVMSTSTATLCQVDMGWQNICSSIGE